jgi:endoglucanase
MRVQARSRCALAALVTTLAGCGSRDRGLAPNSGPGSEAGSGLEESGLDATDPSDAGSAGPGLAREAGSVPEAGFGPEAGLVRDASPARDAGVGPDAGSGPGAGDAAPDVVAADGAPTGGGPNFRCVNWADPGDNFQAGVLQPSGLIAATDSYATVVAKSNAILSGFQTVLGANSIRIPINEATVVTNTAWWNAYKGIVDAALGKNMKVMIAYWGQAGNGGGKPADLNVFFTMWQAVVDAYGSNDLVYFDVMNEPWAYSPTDFINLVVQWMGKYPSVPANRIVVAGNYNDSNVNQQGADARLAGCLLSVHIYAIGSTDANEAHWTSALATAVGPYASRTIVSEYGNDMTTGIDYGGAINGSAAIAYVQGITSQIRASGMGSCYWPGLRNGDTYSITQLNGMGTNLSLSVTNASGLARIQSAWGM